MRYFLFLSSLIIFLASCKPATAPTDQLSDQRTTDTTSIRQLYPLAYGDYWTYDFTQYDTLGNISQDLVNTWEVTHMIERHGTQCYVIDAGSPFQAGLFFSDSDLYSFEASDTIHTSYGMYIHYPMVTGIPIILEDDSTINIHFLREFIFIGKGEPVTVPAGTFSCYHFEYISIGDAPEGLDSVKTMMYLCPGVGLVRQISLHNHFSTMKLENDQQLLSYKVY